MCLNMEEYVDCEWEEYVDCEDCEWQEYVDCEWEDYVVIHRRSEDFKVPTDDDEIDVAAAGEEMDEECYEVPVNRVLEACESSFSKGFRVLNQEGILARVQDDIAKFSSVLSLSEEATTRLLCKYGWNIENLCDQWFPDEDKEKVWKFFGLLGINPIGDQSESAAGFSGDYLVATYMGLGRKGSMRWCPAGCGRAEVQPTRCAWPRRGVVCQATFSGHAWRPDCRSAALQQHQRQSNRDCQRSGGTSVLVCI